MLFIDCLENHNLILAQKNNAKNFAKLFLTFDSQFFFIFEVKMIERTRGRLFVGRKYLSVTFITH